MICIANCSLRERNTFGIEATARQLVEYETVEELQAFIRERAGTGDSSPLLHIGGGSNLLFLGDVEGTVLHSRIRHIEVTAEESDTIYVRVGAGVLWDDWVQYAIDSSWYGLENLSLIPGEVGASAVQNIGAYGAEAKDLIRSIRAVEIATGNVCLIENAECEYGYRQSRFKHDWKNQYLILSVEYEFSETFEPRLDYGNIRA